MLRKKETADLILTPSVIAAYQAELIKAAKEGDLNKIKKLLSQTDCPIDIDARDPVTGRTALHQAYLSKNDAIVKELLLRGASKTIRDKIGFLPLELSINYSISVPEKFDFSEREQIKLARDTLYRFIVSEANNKLAENNVSIVYVKTIREMEDYIESHPKQDRIGILIPTPNVIKMSITEIHISPIYFERKDNMETFVQFDSARMLFILPSKKKGVERKLFYSKYERQASNGGCFADAVIVLMKLLKANGLLSYCESHAKDQTQELSLSLTEKEFGIMDMIRKDAELSGCFPSEEIRNQYLALSGRSEYQRQSMMLAEEKMQPVESIYVLTDLPKLLIPHVERFDTMRDIRMKSPEQLLKKNSTGQTMLSLILASGTVRDNLFKSEIERNLSDPDKRYDFAGPSFLKRHERFSLAHDLRCLSIHKLFHSKVRKGIRLILENETSQIVDTINEFATGITRETLLRKARKIIPGH